jgi:hypothetical protein
LIDEAKGHRSATSRRSVLDPTTGVRYPAATGLCREALDLSAAYARELGTVYFIESGGYIKIGLTYATTVHDRMEAFETSSPLSVRILATIPGNRRLEHKLHKLFHGQHHKREWFASGGPLQEFIGCVRGCPVVDVPRPQSEGHYLNQLHEEMERCNILQDLGDVL